MISVSILTLLVYIALAGAVCIPLLMGVLLISDLKGGKLW